MRDEFSFFLNDNIAYFIIDAFMYFFITACVLSLTIASSCYIKAKPRVLQEEKGVHEEREGDTLVICFSETPHKEKSPSTDFPLMMVRSVFLAIAFFILSAGFLQLKDTVLHNEFGRFYNINRGVVDAVIKKDGFVEADIPDPRNTGIVYTVRTHKQGEYPYAIDKRSTYMPVFVDIACRIVLCSLIFSLGFMRFAPEEDVDEIKGRVSRFFKKNGVVKP